MSSNAHPGRCLFVIPPHSTNHSEQLSAAALGSELSANEWYCDVPANHFARWFSAELWYTPQHGLRDDQQEARRKIEREQWYEPLSFEKLLSPKMAFVFADAVYEDDVAPPKSERASEQRFEADSTNWSEPVMVVKSRFSRFGDWASTTATVEQVLKREVPELMTTMPTSWLQQHQVSQSQDIPEEIKRAGRQYGAVWVVLPKPKGDEAARFKTPFARALGALPTFVSNGVSYYGPLEVVLPKPSMDEAARLKALRDSPLAVLLTFDSDEPSESSVPPVPIDVDFRTNRDGSSAEGREN